MHCQYFARNEYREDTIEMAEGRLAHCAVFEPDKIPERFHIIDINDRPDKAISKSTGNPRTMATTENKQWLEDEKDKADAAGMTLIYKPSMHKDRADAGDGHGRPPCCRPDKSPRQMRRGFFMGGRGQPG